MTAFLASLFGPHWRTTLTGWVAIFFGVIALHPESIAFLPPVVQHYLTGIAGLSSLLSAAGFARLAKDGGNGDDDDHLPPSAAVATGLPTGAVKAALLALGAGAALFCFSACAHQRVSSTSTSVGVTASPDGALGVGVTESLTFDPSKDR